LDLGPGEGDWAVDLAFDGEFPVFAQVGGLGLGEAIVFGHGFLVPVGELAIGYFGLATGEQGE
jgi:hypothetical protein